VAYNLPVDKILARIPVVGGIGYIEDVRRLPPNFSATLVVEPDNRYFRHAIAVLMDGRKVGYVAPEVAASYYDVVSAAAAPVTCAARRASRADHETSGVEILLDFSLLPLQPQS
jgi:hypothetical protein